MINDIKPTKLTIGNWFPTGHQNPAFVGVCAKCETVKPAVTLRLKRLPWGKGEGWMCEECAK